MSTSIPRTTAGINVPPINAVANPMTEGYAHRALCALGTIYKGTPEEWALMVTSCSVCRPLYDFQGTRDQYEGGWEDPVKR